jgi:hypothetical protein
VAIGGNGLPKDDPANVTRFKSPAAKRLQACAIGAGSSASGGDPLADRAAPICGSR